MSPESHQNQTETIDQYKGHLYNIKVNAIKTIIQSMSRGIVESKITADFHQPSNVDSVQHLNQSGESKIYAVIRLGNK